MKHDCADCVLINTPNTVFQQTSKYSAEESTRCARCCSLGRVCGLTHLSFPSFDTFSPGQKLDSHRHPNFSKFSTNIPLACFHSVPLLFPDSHRRKSPIASMVAVLELLFQSVCKPLHFTATPTFITHNGQWWGMEGIYERDSLLLPLLFFRGFFSLASFHHYIYFHTWGVLWFIEAPQNTMERRLGSVRVRVVWRSMKSFS